MRRLARLWWLFPVAVALQPPLHLFVANRYGLEATGPVLLSAVVALGACLLLLAVLTALVGDRLVAGAVVALAFIFLYGYVPLYAIVFDAVFRLFGADVVLTVVRHRYLLPAFALAVGWLMWLSVRHRQALRALAPILAMTGGVLLLQPVLTLLAGAAAPPHPAQPVVEDIPAPPMKPEELPNIYYIVLDAYGSQEELLSSYGFDNAPFVERLRELGFYVADDSRANYPDTRFSLASSLNLRYLDGLGRLSHERTTELVDNNRLERFLKSLGYRIVRFPTWFEATRPASHADLRLGPIRGPGLSPLANFVVGRSLFSFALYRMLARQAWEHASQVFELLPSVAQMEGPTFVFAHILCPHDPFVFDERGNRLPFEGWGWETADPRNKARYLGQVTFVNQQVDRLLSRLLAERHHPIIVIQGDHGPKVPQAGLDVYESGILNAVLLPDGGTDALYPSITPVNTFRLILDRYFGTRLGLLPDRLYSIRETPTSLEFLPAGGGADSPSR